MKPKPQIHLRSRLLPILVGILLLMQFIDPSPVWKVLLVGMGGAWLVSYLWVRVLSANLALLREMRFGWAQVGDRLEERFTLTNHGWVPAVWAEIIDGSDLPGYNASQVTGAGPGSSTRWRTEGYCTQRGIFRLGPTSLQTGDTFGFYSLRLEDPASTNVIVMPPVVPLPGIEVAAGGRLGEARPRAAAPDRTASASGVREYLPGDSQRLIHWRTSARQDELYVRLLEGTPAGDWWILLDLEQRVQAGQGWESTEEHGVILAASLADRGLRSLRAVGLIASSETLTWLPPKEGEGQRWEILRALALVSPGAHSLSQILLHNRQAIGQRASLVIITPNTRDDWPEKLVPLLWRGVVPTVLLLDPGSFDPAVESAGGAETMLEALREMGVSCYRISRDQLDRPDTRPGRQGEWEWRYTPTGRAIPVKRPGNLAWKKLS